MKRYLIRAGGLMLLACLLLAPWDVWADTEASLPLDLRDHWSAPYAITMLEQGMLTGYTNGRFYPDEALSREEAASLLCHLLDHAGVTLNSQRDGPMPYRDLTDRWSEPLIHALWQSGILEDAEAFRPSESITRGDMARYLALCLDLLSPQELEEDAMQPDEHAVINSSGTAPEDFGTADAPAQGTSEAEAERALPEGPFEEASPAPEPARPAVYAFTDITASSNAPYIQTLYERGLVTGDSSGQYHPDGSLTRGEGAALLFRASGCALSGTTFAPLPDYRVIPVPYISQLYPVNAPVGCEPTCLLMALQAKGYALEVPLGEFLDAMPKTTSDPAKGFVGSPYQNDPTKKTRTTIYPPILTEFGLDYGTVIDLSGATLHEIQREVLSGNPVVVYVTLYWEKPYYRDYNIEGQVQSLLSNNHAVLVCGYHTETHQYYIADPYNIKNRSQDYFYWIDGATFDPLYLERCHALAVI